MAYLRRQRIGEKLVVTSQDMTPSKRVAQLDSDGKVINVILLPEDVLNDEWNGHPIVDVRGNVAPGDTWDGTTFIKQTPVTPASSRRDVLRQKLIDKTITPEEKDELLLILAES